MGAAFIAINILYSTITQDNADGMEVSMRAK
jgi:hypothetical protein